jgi:hypothetical protein
MAGNNAVGCGKAYTGTLKIGHVVHALKGSKKFIGVFHIETRAIVFYIINYFAVIYAVAYFNHRPLFFARKLNCI